MFLPIRFFSSRFFTTSFKKGSFLPYSPLLMSLSKEIQDYVKINLENTHIVGVQHLLPTTYNLFGDVLCNRFSLKPYQCWLAGKCYSTDPETRHYLALSGMHVLPHTMPRYYGKYYEEAMLPDIDALWVAFSKNYSGGPIIIMDDGGDLIIRMPAALKEKSLHRVIALEQTTNGIMKLEKIKVLQGELPCPVINVARSGAKSLESPLIAVTIIDRLREMALFQNKNLKCGIIGRGFIGKAVLTALKKMGYVKIYVHENNINQRILNGVIYTERIEDLFTACDIILGCTAEDPFLTTDIEVLLNNLKHPLTLVSCSSGDTQFGSILRYIQTQHKEEVSDIMADIVYGENQYLKILQGGFPINFTRNGLCDPEELFSFTRGLLMAGVINAYELLILLMHIGNNQQIIENDFIQLSPGLQKITIAQWIHHSPYAKKMYGNLNVEALVQRSEGIIFPFMWDNIENNSVPSPR